MWNLALYDLQDGRQGFLEATIFEGLPHPANWQQALVHTAFRKVVRDAFSNSEDHSQGHSPSQQLTDAAESYGIALYEPVKRKPHAVPQTPTLIAVPLDGRLGSLLLSTR